MIIMDNSVFLTLMSDRKEVRMNMEQGSKEARKEHIEGRREVQHIEHGRKEGVRKKRRKVGRKE